MPYAAITYDILPGHDEEIARIFSEFRRASSPVLHDEAGNEVGRLLGTAVFISGATMVRFIHYSGGELDDIGRHMAKQEGVHDVERKLKPYLASERNTATEQGFRRHFARSTMRCISQLSIETLDAAPTGDRS